MQLFQPPVLFLCVGICTSTLSAQDRQITGRLLDAQNGQPVAGVSVGDPDFPGQTLSDSEGRFALAFSGDSLLLTFSGPGYRVKTYPLGPGLPDTLELGEVRMRPELDQEAEQDVATLSEPLPDEDLDTGMPLLQAGRDLFLGRVAFDFSAGYFRARGLDSRESDVFLNGVPMNRAYDGRVAWSSWGGLTDIGRHSDQSYGWAFSVNAFGGLLGSTEIRAAPSALRPGIRLTTSFGNRSYQFRQMATYNTGMNRKGLGVLLSLSNRLGATGYIAGTPFESQAGYAALEWQPDRANTWLVAGVFSHTRRGMSSPLTEELASLKGSRYNPNWGWHEGKVRSSRQRTEAEPMLMFLYSHQTQRVNWAVAAGYQWGVRMRSRLASFGAPNPDPAYYRNLPSFYYNSPLGANYRNTSLSAASFRDAPQIDWEALYRTNRGRSEAGRAFYILHGDEERGRRLHLRTTVSYRFAKPWSLQAALRYSSESLDFCGRLLDLLGADYHEDRDPFSNTLNDVDGALQKAAGDRIGYHYNLKALLWDGFLQARWEKGSWDAWASVRAGSSRTGRTGFFRNERYPAQAGRPGGEAPKKRLDLKAGLGYRLSGHQWVYGYFAHRSRPPLLRDVFTDAREHGRLFPMDDPETATGGSADLYFRHPWLKGRISAYYLRLAGARSIRSYFAETGYGAAFMREVTGDIASLHRGVETGLEIRINPSVALTLAGAGGAFTYSGNPRTWLYYYGGTDDREHLPENGVLSPGSPQLAGLHLARGPEWAASAGLSYRDPAFWWVDLRANYLGSSYEDLAVLRYSGDFALQAGTALQDPGAQADAIGELRAQRPLPSYYLLNLSVGKSWLRGRHYVSVFAGLNNLFDQISRTGGYQQGRLATYSGLAEDSRSGHPSFGTRYWYGAGRTFFLNISWSF